MDISEKLFNDTKETRKEINEELGLQNKGLFEDLINTEDGFEVFAGLTGQQAKRTGLLKSSLSWVYACLSARANEVANINLHLLKMDKGGNDTEIFEHPSLELLWKVNNGMTKFGLFWLTEQYLGLTGEAPWFIARNGSGQPENILLLRPDQITVLPPKEEDDIIGGYIYRVATERGGYKEIKLLPDEVIFHRYPDPNRPLRGLGPLQAVIRAYETDQKAAKYNEEFFNRSAVPSAVLQTAQKLTKEQKERLAKKFKEQYAGVANSHKTMILEAGLEYKSMSLSQREMDFLESRKFNRDEILAVFRVPRTVLGITDDVNRANAEATDYVFASRTIKPEMQMITETLNEFFLSLYPNTENLYFSFDDPTPQNKELLIKFADSGVLNGYLTVNEARTSLGLAEIEGGDNLREPNNQPTILSLKGTHNAKQRIRAKNYKKEIMADAMRFANDIIANTFTSIVKDQLKKERKVKEEPVSLKYPVSFQGEELKKWKFNFQEKILTIANEFEPVFINRMNKIFRSQKRKVLEQFPDTKSEKAKDPKNIKLDIETEIEITVENFKPLVKKVIIKQSKPAYQLIGLDRELSTAVAPVANYLTKRTFRFSKEITKETNEALGNALAEGIKKGESIGELKKRVTELFDGFEGYRSERVARSETIRATNFASETAWKESGLVEAKEWLATIDERTDDDCLRLDGKIVNLGKGFARNDYDGIVEQPPIHVNCRCTLIPIVI